jgi:hypothetical protein
MTGSVKKSMEQHERMDCFVASLLAMTTRHASAISQREALELYRQLAAPSEKEGVGNAGRPMHPQPRVRIVESTRVSHHRSTEIIRHSRTQWF